MTHFDGRVVGLRSAYKARLWRHAEGVAYPVAADALELLRVTHHTFHGTVEVGWLVVHGEVADECIGIFKRLFKARFPIERIRLLTDFGHCDHCSMADNNSYGYGYRTLDDGVRLSWHSLGLAIDINPRQNPVIDQRRAESVDAADYVDREHHRPGMITPGSAAYDAFRETGWEWGGEWTSFKDYHHFQRPLAGLDAVRLTHLAGRGPGCRPPEPECIRGLHCQPEV